ncbi:aconitase family protein [Escherichia coli]|uniref:aconitase family protein n=1 Tax=Escherichia coli TaxID=562 RepID=UPI001FF262FB|nr:aconitase family protein [Escherichia coli]MCJ8456269.1 aconitase family protein [Escherichia coli]
MIKLSEKGVFLASNNEIIAEEHFTGEIKKEEAKKGTIAWSILSSHNTSGNMDKLKIKFDSLASHDITFVGIVQTAKASGMERFPLPYVLTNCHNSLCAVGGTINGDDHVFGLSAAQRYGGIFVPPHIAVIHQYMREMMAGGGKMILGSDSHTRYGALGTMAVGEGGGELVKQLLNDTWDIDYLTSASELDCWDNVPEYAFDVTPYKNRVYQGFVKGATQQPLIYGPNIKDWPELGALTDNIVLKVCSKILDEVTTTDELIPSGETSSYRSNPIGLAEFTLSRRDPGYVGRSKATAELENQRLAGNVSELTEVFARIKQIAGQEHIDPLQTEIGSMVYAVKPGDGSAREQAASCQRVIGGLANIAEEYATKRYRSNVINWGMLPLQMAEVPTFEVGDYIYIPGIKAALDNPGTTFKGYVIHEDAPVTEITLYMESLTAEEREIIKAGSLINFNKNRQM